MGLFYTGIVWRIMAVYGGERGCDMAKRTICVDMDGVLAKYDGWKGVDHIGEPIDGAREFLRKLSKKYEVAIFTTRCNAVAQSEYTERELIEKVRDWLQKHEMHWDLIIPGKPLCVGFVDDNAIRCRPQDEEWAFDAALSTLRG